MPTVVYSIYHAHLKHTRRGMESNTVPSSSASTPPTEAVELLSDALSLVPPSLSLSISLSFPFHHRTSSSRSPPSTTTPSPTIASSPSTQISSTSIPSSSPSSTQSSDVPPSSSSSSEVDVRTQFTTQPQPSSGLAPTPYSSSVGTSTVAASPVSQRVSGSSGVSPTASSQPSFSPSTLTTMLVTTDAGITYTTYSMLVDSSTPPHAVLSVSPTNPAAFSNAPQNSGPQPSLTSLGSAVTASMSNTAHHPPLALILGTSLGGGGLIAVVIAICIVYLVKRRRNAWGPHHLRAASRNESFFAPERPLVSPFPTLSRPQSHATTTSLANTLNDEERWAEYRNAYQSPPLLPGAGLVSRDTLLVDHHVEALSPPAQMQDMGYAVLSRSSPLSAAFPHEEHIVSPTPSHMPLLPEDAGSVRAYAYTSFTAPDSTSSPTSASFPQYIVYDGIDVGSVTDTLATPSGQRIPIAATNSHDSSLQSPSMFSARGSFNSLRSDGSAGSVHPDESSMGMAI